MEALDEYLEENILSIYGNGTDNDQHQVIWLGDFNRHHPMWDNDHDERLFTPHALSDADRLIMMIAKWDMSMLLPKGIQTLEHQVTKRYSRPDNVFATQGIQEKVVHCKARPDLRPPR
ncbi:hypothetical protein BKA70DRAFT_1115550, partial [Coprinopsis sp. MPI-PUGE-AT-0042]